MDYRLFAIVLMMGTYGCVPQHLQKYRKSESAADERGAVSLAGPNAEINRRNPAELTPCSIEKGAISDKKQATIGRAAQVADGRATVYAVDQQTFRFMVREDDVWDGALRVLLKNYNVNIIDRDSGIITTEWDSYYLNDAVYRNKVSLHIRRVSRDAVDVTIRNNVERLQDGAIAGTVGAVWLPGDDTANEVNRLVQNMALALNQPPPVLPPNSAVAKSTEEKDILSE